MEVGTPTQKALSRLRKAVENVEQRFGLAVLFALLGFVGSQSLVTLIVALVVSGLYAAFWVRIVLDDPTKEATKTIYAIPILVVAYGATASNSELREENQLERTVLFAGTCVLVFKLVVQSRKKDLLRSIDEAERELAAQETVETE